MILAGTSTLTLLAALVVAFFYIRWLERRLKAALNELFRSDGDNPSTFALVVQNAGAVIANEIAVRLKTSLMGMSSAVTRQEKAAEGALIKDVIGSHPIGGIALGMLPNLSKVIGRNPAIGAGLLELLGKLGGKGPAAAAGNGSDSRNDSLLVT